MDIKDLWNRYNVYIAGGLFLAVVVIVAVMIFPKESRVEVIDPLPVENLEEESEEMPAVIENTHIFVEVKGAVKYPGVFEMPADARVKNVLEMAQVEPSADLLSVNQSMKLVDEMVIYIPKEGEMAEFNPSAGYDSASESDSEAANSVVNINTAGVPELTTLNGIGEKKAQLIIDYREENGLFMKEEDLMNIPGIGEKTFESLKPYITID